ncbi:MAG: GNAT family N-acetyltransferase [Defluviitaleaceae bacterium]|nr:GNAT family N-acetyltransferase [Defluviitaleaceae bacterium]
MDGLFLDMLREDDIPLLPPILEGDGQPYDPERIRAFLGGKDNLAFVAKLDGKVIGLIYGYRFVRLSRPEPLLYVYSVDVLTGYRGLGCGTRLFQFVVDYARENGYAELFTDAYKSNLPACRIYEKPGLTASEDVTEYSVEFSR